MRLQVTTLSRLTSFLLGVAWAIAVIGAVSAFASFFKINLLVACVAALLGAVPGLLMVLFLEYLILKSETAIELQKQTVILEKIAEAINKD